MTTAANTQASKVPPSGGPNRNTRIRRRAGTTGTYLLLIAIGAVFVFPFIFMVTTALKTSEEVFRYPPQLLPMQAATATYEGEPLPLYRIPVEGEMVEMVPVETGVRAGIFAPADDLEATVVVPLEDATAILDADGAEVLLAVGDDELPAYEIDGEQVVKVRNTSVAEFVSPTDPSLTGYAVVRTAEAVERPTAHPENFPDVLERGGFDRSLTNTILITMAVVFGQLFTSIIGGYAFARIPFPFRNTLFFIYLGSIMIPFVVLIIPLYQLMVGMGWVDSIPALIFPWIFTRLRHVLDATVLRDPAQGIGGGGLHRRRQSVDRDVAHLRAPEHAGHRDLGAFAFLYAWNSFVWPFIVISTGKTDAQVLTVALQPVRWSRRGSATASLRGRGHRGHLPDRGVRHPAALLRRERRLQRHQVGRAAIAAGRGPQGPVHDVEVDDRLGCRKWRVPALRSTPWPWSGGRRSLAARHRSPAYRNRARLGQPPARG